MTHNTYEVRVLGIMPEEDLRDLGAFAVAHEGARTVLYGEIVDEAALYALLSRLQDRRIEVLEVRQVPELTRLDLADPSAAEEPDRPGS